MASGTYNKQAFYSTFSFVPFIHYIRIPIPDILTFFICTVNKTGWHKGISRGYIRGHIPGLYLMVISQGCIRGDKPGSSVDPGRQESILLFPLLIFGIQIHIIGSRPEG